MAWSFGDSFDLYAVPGDMINGYWDSAAFGAQVSFVAGRFAGSQAASIVVTGSLALTKSSNVNDAVHHFVVAFRQTAAIGGTNLGTFFQLQDGTTAQCTVIFRTDGAILLTSGSFGGATLATYTGAFPVVNTWYAFEIEVVINNTTGAFRVRKNGNSVNDFDSGATLNTRGGTANNYANKLVINQGTTVNAQQLDDLFWQSGAATGNWLGDIRCYARMPVTDQSVTFSKSPTSFFAQGTAATGSNSSYGANSITACAVVAPTTGTVSSFSFNFNSALTGHAKMALYDSTGAGGGPGALMGAQSIELTNPGPGVVTFSVTGGPTVQRGVTYYVAIWSDASTSGNGGNFPYRSLAASYTTNFPSTMAGFSSGTQNGIGSNGMNVTPFNAGCVNEAQQDGATSYVFDSNPGDADFYGVASIASTPAQVIATTTRAYMQKSDAGTRTAAVQLKSGATTVASPTLVLTTSGFQWAWRTDLVDPNTGAAWTAAAVNNAQIGPKTIA